MSGKPREFLNVAGAVAYIRAEYGVSYSASTVRRYVRRGHLPATRTKDGKILVTREAVDALFVEPLNLP